MYQQQSSQQPSFGQTQYRGASSQGRFQPTGYVQSYYQGATSAPTTSIGGQFGSTGYQNQTGYQQGGYVSTDSFHTANYHGNQPGHDNYLRADSVNPSTYQTGYTPSFQNTFQSGIGQQTSGQSYQQYGGISGTGASYHTANYRGNQPGHDNYLRADSTSPSNIGFTGVSSFGTGQYQAQAQAPTSPQAYHTSQYVGNQPGHDQYLRADSTSPSQYGQGQFGGGFR